MFFPSSPPPMVGLQLRTVSSARSNGTEARSGFPLRRTLESHLATRFIVLGNWIPEHKRAPQTRETDRAERSWVD